MKTTNKMYEGYSEEAILKLKIADSDEYPEAKLKYDEIIKDFPDPAYAYAKRGYVFHKLGKFQEAIDDFDVAISKKPQAKNTIWQRGISKWRIGQLNEALVDLRIYANLKPDDSEVFFWMGTICTELGDVFQAEKNFESAISLNKNYSEAIEKLNEIRNGKVST